MIKTIRTRILALPRSWKRAILVGFDIVVLSAALWLSFALRYDRWSISTRLEDWLVILSAPATAIPVFVRMGLYRAVVRYLPERALWTMLRAVTLAAILWLVIAFLTEMAVRGAVPRSVPFIYWSIASIAIIGSRFAAKWLFWPAQRRLMERRPAVVIYGAGEAGSQLAASMRNSHFIAGFIDDDHALHRREVAGLRVHPASHLPVLVRDFGVRDVILCMPSISASRRKEIVTDVGKHGVKVQSLPGITDLVTGKYLVSQVREIDVEDLLGRSSVPPDLDLIREMVAGKTVMVTGAGGSIGSELCRKIAQWGPQRLILFEANEFALYKIDKELGGRDEVAVIPVLASVTDQTSVRHAIADHAVDCLLYTSPSPRDS